MVTPTPPSNELLLKLGGDLRWPSVQLGRYLLAGTPAAWQSALFRPPLTPMECARLLGRLERHLLVATPGGRARLRRWIAEQKTAPSTPVPRWLAAKWIREHVSFYGDGPMLPAVVRALTRVPAPVQAAALDEITFLGVGADTRGWAGSSTLLDRDGERRPRLIVLSGHDLADVERFTLHEIAHAWGAPLPHEGSMLISAQAEEQVFALARREGWPAVETYERDERLAIALEKIWAGTA